jgi:hypothetical protein
VLESPSESWSVPYTPVSERLVQTYLHTTINTHLPLYTNIPTNTPPPESPSESPPCRREDSTLSHTDIPPLLIFAQLCHNVTYIQYYNVGYLPISTLAYHCRDIISEWILEQTQHVIRYDHKASLFRGLFHLAIPQHSTFSNWKKLRGKMIPVTPALPQSSNSHQQKWSVTMALTVSMKTRDRRQTR